MVDKDLRILHSDKENTEQLNGCLKPRGKDQEHDH